MRSTLEVIHRMREQGIIREYAIGGAVGATFYVQPAATEDIDVFLLSAENPAAQLISLSPIYEYLAALGYKAEREYVNIEGWPVQFLPASDALDEEALRDAVEADVEGLHARVLSAEHLVAIALRTGRAKDFARILQFLESGVLDRGKLHHILSRYGLLEKWKAFEARFL